MILCLRCRYLTPSGSVYCSGCGSTFGSRRCEKEHLSPASARFCTTCGSGDLTRATGYLPLGCLSRALAWILLLWGLRLAVFHRESLLRLLGRFTGAILSFVFGPCWLCQLLHLMTLVLFFALIYVAIRGLIGERVSRMKPGFGDVWWVLRVCGWLISSCLRLLFIGVEGRQVSSDQAKRMRRK